MQLGRELVTVEMAAGANAKASQRAHVQREARRPVLAGGLPHASRKKLRRFCGPCETRSFTRFVWVPIPATSRCNIASNARLVGSRVGARRLALLLALARGLWAAKKKPLELAVIPTWSRGDSTQCSSAASCLRCVANTCRRIGCAYCSRSSRVGRLLVARHIPRRHELRLEPLGAQPFRSCTTRKNMRRESAFHSR